MVFIQCVCVCVMYLQTIRLWEISRGKCVRELQACPSLPVIALHYTTVKCFEVIIYLIVSAKKSISFQGILATCSGNVISLWSTVKGERVIELRGHKDR